MTQYAARYRAARGYADLTQEQLAERLGLEVKAIKRREAGTQEPKKAELIAVAAVCEVPLEFLENGWGYATRDELAGLVSRQNELLADQSSLIEEIRDDVRAQREIRDEIEELVHEASRNLVDPPADREDRRAAPPRHGASRT